MSLFVLAALSVSLAPARADDVGTAKEKLYQAKKEYDGEARKFRKAVGDWFDKRDTEARNAGNKKLVDQLKAERETFEKSGGLPPEVSFHAPGTDKKRAGETRQGLYHGH